MFDTFSRFLLGKKKTGHDLVPFSFLQPITQKTSGTFLKTAHSRILNNQVTFPSKDPALINSKTTQHRQSLTLNKPDLKIHKVTR